VFRFRLELTLSDSGDRPASVRPLGLVLKAGLWHLVHLGRHGIDVLDFSELRSTRLTSEPFRAPDGFDLAEFWRHHLAERQQRSRRNR
jgi:predicted DNA-binding transcriptional regulator YafY